MATNTPISVGIIGFGRSGRDIHAAALSTLPDRFKISAVCDRLPERAAEAEAELGCAQYATATELIQHPGLELVIVATPNNYHAAHVLAALRAGKNVLCEKPFGFTLRDVDEMIAAAATSGKILQAFQQRRYEPDFQKLKEVCDSGVLGKITFVRIAWHGFTRRWDWQTSREFGGGQLYNNGPHPIDHALELFGAADPNVWCELRQSLSSGDAEDEVRILLSAPNAPTIQIELLSTAAYPQDRWFVCGTAGSLHGGTSRMDWKWVDWSQLPNRQLDTTPTKGRSYNNEKLPWMEAFWDAQRQTDAGAGATPASQPALAFYDDFWKTLKEGKSQVIPPQQTRRRIEILERCYQQSHIPFPKTPATL